MNVQIKKFLQEEAEQFINNALVSDMEFCSFNGERVFKKNNDKIGIYRCVDNTYVLSVNDVVQKIDYASLVFILPNDGEFVLNLYPNKKEISAFYFERDDNFTIESQIYLHNEFSFIAWDKLISSYNNMKLAVTD